MRAKLALAPIAALLIAAACSSGGTLSNGPTVGTPEPAADQVTVLVNNDLIPPTTLSVWAAPERGARQLLGNATPSSTVTLAFVPTVASSSYRLVARTTAGHDIQSNPVVLAAGDSAVWSVQANTVTVR